MVSFTQITKIITEMLYKHDCVIIPNLGGFVARQHSASFSKGQDMILPPSKQVLFNKNLVHNDGLLVNALSQKANLPYSESLKIIEDYKDYILSLLSSKNRFELDQLGLLYLDSEKILRFEQKVDVNFLIDSFGFEPVIAQFIPIQEEPKTIILEKFVDRKETTTPARPKKTKSYLRMAAITISAPLVFASLFFALSSSNIKPLLESSVNPFYSPLRNYSPIEFTNNSYSTISVAKTDTPIETENGLAYYKIENSDKIIIASVSEKTIETSVKTITKKEQTNNASFLNFEAPFQVVIGCFSVEENANRLIRELQKNNIKAAISGTNTKGLHVVSCGGFLSKDQAVEKLQEVKNDFPSAWIMAK
jgi:nucleoid DNA-binding protein